MAKIATYTAATAVARFTANPNIAPLAVSDSPANVLTWLDGLERIAQAAKLVGIGLKGKSNPLLTVTATQFGADADALLHITSAFRLAVQGPVSVATAIAASSRLIGKLAGGLSVADSAAHVSAGLNQLQTLAGGGKLAAISLTDGGTPTISLNAATFATDGGALGRIISPFALSVSQVTAAGVAATAAAAHVTQVAVLDTAGNIATNLDSLESVWRSGELGAISVINPGTTVTVSSAMLTNDADVIALLSGSITFNGGAAPPPPGTPTITQTLNGIPYTYWYPPDNALAVGPSAIVSSENSQIEWTDLSGHVATNESLTTFFAPLTPYGSIFDPHAVFDAVNQRYVVVAAEANSTSTRSSLLVAVSHDANPADGWSFQQINAAVTVGGVATWADYPSLAIDGQNIVISTNQFSTSGYFQASVSYLLGDVSGTNGGLYAGGTSSLSQSYAGNWFSYQEVGAPGVGSFAVSYVGDQLQMVFHAEVGGYGSEKSIALGNIDSGSSTGYTAQQKGTSALLDAGDGRIPSAVYANGNLYAVFEVNPGTGTPAVHWVELNVSNPTAPSLVAQGNIIGAALGSGVAIFNPSIAVDQQGDVLINFTASGPNLYPSDYFVVAHGGTSAGSAPGGFGAPILYKAGTVPYADPATSLNGTGTSRWGDYSSAVADPNNGGGFWISNEFAATSSSWGTVIAQVLAGTSAPLSPSGGGGGGTPTTSGPLVSSAQHDLLDVHDLHADLNDANRVSGHHPEQLHLAANFANLLPAGDVSLFAPPSG